MGRTNVQTAAEALGQRLQKAGIDYAVAGTLALWEHGLQCVARDLDVLITREGLARFKSEWLGRGYAELPEGGDAVRDTVHNVTISFLIAGEFPGDGRPKPVAFPDPAGETVMGVAYRVLKEEKLIELKLASGMTAQDGRQDFAHVVALIMTNGHPLHYTARLHPYVHVPFIETWRIAQDAEEDS